MVSDPETNPADFTDWTSLHGLLSGAFAYMADRIDPPSSMTRLTVADIAAKAAAEDLFLVRDGVAPVACLFGAVTGDAYYIGKLAVAPGHRGRGLSRRLIEAAAERATALGCVALELQSRVELVENHATFAALGFVQVGASSHPGYDRPTTLTFRRSLQGFPPSR
jgi:GNAT superfamily N-acetyltransferase